MHMKRVAFIIPGFGHTPKLQIYQDIACEFEKKGIEAVILDIPWNRKVMSDYVKVFKEKYQQLSFDEGYVLGFSFGAMISFISSPELKFKTQILCSLSPWFKEDLPYLKAWWKKVVGKRRVSDLTGFSYRDLARDIDCRTILLAGSKEEIEVERNNQAVFSLLKCPKEYFVIEGAKHDITQDLYREQIYKTISELF